MVADTVPSMAFSSGTRRLIEGSVGDRGQAGRRSNRTRRRRRRSRVETASCEKEPSGPRYPTRTRRHQRMILPLNGDPIVPRRSRAAQLPTMARDQIRKAGAMGHSDVRVRRQVHRTRSSTTAATACRWTRCRSTSAGCARSPRQHDGLSSGPRVTILTRSSTSSATTLPRRSSRSTRPTSWPSSPTPRPRTRCSSTWSSPARGSTAPAGSSRPASWPPRTRRSTFLAELAGMPDGLGRRLRVGRLASATSRASRWAATWRRSKRPDLDPARRALRDLGRRPLERRQGAARDRRRARWWSRPTTIASRGSTSRRPWPTTRTPTPCSASWRPRAPPTPASSTTSRVSAASLARHDLWFHVDGAYGGAAAVLAHATATSSTGLRHADSFVVDPHKWLFAPLDCARADLPQPHRRAQGPRPAGQLPRHPARAATTRTTSGTRPTSRMHLSRRARGLPVLVLARHQRHRRLRDRGPGGHRPGPSNGRR